MFTLSGSGAFPGPRLQVGERRGKVAADDSPAEDWSSIPGRMGEVGTLLAHPGLGLAKISGHRPAVWKPGGLLGQGRTGTLLQSVDAAYTNWGDGAAGPFPSSGSLVCGAVTVAPWLPNDGSGGMFSGGDCSGTSTPDQTFTSEQSAYNSAIASLQSLCNNGNFLRR